MSNSRKPEITSLAGSSIIILALILIAGCSVGETLPTLQPNPIDGIILTPTLTVTPILLSPTLTDAPIIDQPNSASLLPTMDVLIPTLGIIYPHDHACSLFTSADAELILGHPVKQPESPLDSSGTHQVTSCKYYADVDESFENAQLVIMKFNSPEEAHADFDLVRNEAPATFQTPAVDLLDLGDQAFWVAGDYQTLFVLNGLYQLQFSASDQEGEQVPEALNILMQVILDRLPVNK